MAFSVTVVERLINDHFPELQETWKSIGLKNESKIERLKILFLLIGDIFNDEIEYGEKTKLALHQKIADMRSSMKRFREDMNFQDTDDCSGVFPADMDLYDQFELLAKKFEELRTIREERENKFNFLTLEEESLCQSLGQTPFYSKCPLSSESLRDFQTHIDALKKDLVGRLERVTQVRQLASSLDLDADDIEDVQVSYVVFASPAELQSAKLDEAFMVKLERIRGAMEKVISQRRKEIATAYTRLNDVCLRLDMQPPELGDWRRIHGKLHPTKADVAVIREGLQSLEKEIEPRIGDYIKACRKEICRLYATIFASNTLKSTFTTQLQSSELTLELLKAHEEHIKDLQERYLENQVTFDAANGWLTAWNNLQEVDNDLHNPVYIRDNRGGILLKLDKQKKVCERKLERRERELRAMDEGDLKVNGVSILDHISRIKEEAQKARENSVKERAARQEETLKKDMLYGSKPVTPAAKRKLQQLQPSRLDTRLHSDVKRLKVSALTSESRQRTLTPSKRKGVVVRKNLNSSHSKRASRNRRRSKSVPSVISPVKPTTRDSLPKVQEEPALCLFSDFETSSEHQPAARSTAIFDNDSGLSSLAHN